MRKFGSVGVVAALALVLSGCTGTTPEPSESPSASSAAPSSSAPASPTPKPATSTSPAENIEPPEMPDLAKEFSAAGFEAFVDYWFEARNYAVATGDVEPMMAVSHDECQFCVTQATGIQQVYGDKGWTLGGEAIPSEFYTGMRELIGGVYHAGFTLEQKSGTTYSSTGEVLEDYSFTEGMNDYEFMALYDDGWTAAIIQFADTEAD